MQVLPPAHIEKYYLGPTNQEGERLKEQADQRYILWGQDSKWRRWKTMTVDRYYAFWIAKLVTKAYG